jgi:hypothetical protein
MAEITDASYKITTIGDPREGMNLPLVFRFNRNHPEGARNFKLPIAN